MPQSSNDNTNEKAKKQALIFALVVTIATLACVGYVMCRYHPTGISTDAQGNIVLNTFIGHNAPIPADSIELIATPEEGLMTHLIHTNGASYGRVKYGHFKSTKTGTKMFLYLTGKPDTACFKAGGRLYVTDNWRK